MSKLKYSQKNEVYNLLNDILEFINEVKLRCTEENYCCYSMKNIPDIVEKLEELKLDLIK